MLLIVVYIVYPYGFLGGAVVFDLIGHFLNLLYLIHKKPISNFPIFNFVASQYFSKNLLYLLILEQIENFKLFLFYLNEER